MDLLKHLDKRQHIWTYDTENIPTKEIIDDILYKAWKVTPSKNNFMPYHVNVLGPDKLEDKLKVLALSKLNKKRTNERANVNNIPNYEEDGDNPNFLFYRTVPYLLIYSQRVADPNPYIERTIKNNNDIYEQMHASMFGEFQTTAAVEIGQFQANMTAFALEYGIDTTQIKCYPADMEDWTEFDFVEGPVMLIAGLGYAVEGRRVNLDTWSNENDYKPEAKEIIRHISS